jgi:hypothetical protein
MLDKQLMEVSYIFSQIFAHSCTQKHNRIFFWSNLYQINSFPVR